MRRLLLLLCVLLLAGPARADDIAATARGVVRIVTIAVIDGQVVGFGHGSGFAVAPDRIVTNAHVVELAQRYPDNVVIGVVPSEGDRSFQGRLLSVDARADLALVRFEGARLPPATLYTGPVGEGAPVVALGYPGNVDLATARSAADYIRPTSPVRSEAVLLHTAAIARGNSGGPLLDRCGRVIGANSAITRGEDGDGSFGFAIAQTELSAFLRTAEQPYASTGEPCTSIEERIRADAEADARVQAGAERTRLETASRRAAERAAQAEQARDAALTARENTIALAALLLVAGALTLGGAGMLEVRGRRRPAVWTAAGGGVAMVAAAIVFLLRPSAAVVPSADVGLPAVAADTPALASGSLVCTFDPQRSRVTVSSTADVLLDWNARGCVGKTQYVEREGRWERVLVPEGEQTVSLLALDPATGRYTATRYFLGAGEMDAARTARGTTPGACTTAPATLERLAERQAALRALLPPLPNEKLSYSCRRGGD
jgi:S1-C subfamily serine protease